MIESNTPRSAELHWSSPDDVRELLAREGRSPDEPAPHIIPLVGSGATETALVGGKAAQLAELAALGLPVPVAYFVTTAAYRAYLAGHDLGRWLADATRRVSLQEPASAVRLADEVRRRFAECSIPAGMADEIRRGYRELLMGDASRPVAVRSSASMEDGRIASFAGQCESLLNVRGEVALLEAVVACWASLHSVQALLYRARQHLLDVDCAAGVVVQNLVPADRAAVAFSANPVDGDRSCVVVNSSWGLGEAIVSGLVNPDTYYVNKHDFSIRSQVIADKVLMTVPLPDGGTEERPVPTEKRRAPSLRLAEVQELARVATRLEMARSHPVDVEFAFAGPRLAVLQCRPITTL